MNLPSVTHYRMSEAVDLIFISLRVACQGLTICVIDKEVGPVECGHADGMEDVRSLTVLE